MNSDIKKRLFRTLVLSFVALCIGVAIGLFQISGQPGKPAQSGASVMRKITPVAGAALGGGFSLINHDGQPVSDADFAGKYQLIYFGFTYCPAICPTELQKISQVLNGLGAKGEVIQPLFITIDPERDTAAVMKDYVALFHDRFIGLTGSVEQVQKVLKDYRVYANKVQDETMSEYTMDHSSYIYLMDPGNELLAIYSIDDTVDQVVKDIQPRI